MIRKEYNIHQLLIEDKIPRFIFTSPIDKNNTNISELIYCDNYVCYYESFDGTYLYIDTIEAIGLCEDNIVNNDKQSNILNVTDLAVNYIFVDEDQDLLKDIADKFNNFDSIKNNCFITDKFEKKLSVITTDKYEQLNALKSCTDFKKLKNTIIYNDLIDMEKVLEDYEEFLNMYSDGKKDIIGEYTQKYGHTDLIYWYEGLIATDDLINIYKEKYRNIEVEI